jgi:asparagine synthase (glutamine-hydrolysing)
MCGIVGLALRSEAQAQGASERVARAVQSLRHRGPDAQAQWDGGRVLLGHTRLSILDLSTLGSQPMLSADGRYALSYNGEVYNFRELAGAENMSGLRSASDTEVVLRLFEKQGVASLARLNGMFAFAIHDRVANKLWLVRDRLGIKPLYFSIDAGSLAFGSEIKAIHTLRGSRPVCAMGSLHEWLYFGNPLGANTLHAGIEQLLPGHYLELDLGAFTHSTRPYWSLSEQVRHAPAVPLVRASLIGETRRLLDQAVRRQLVADVPVGLFLSGGVDSSALAAYATRHHSGRLSTYSAGFDFQPGEGELPKARRVAAHFGTDHHEIHIKGGDVAELVEDLVFHHDMPFGDAANIPLALMARQLGGQVKVVLQGDGGDELFGGYSRTQTFAHYGLLRAFARVLSPALALMPKNALYYRARRYLRALTEPEFAASMALLLTSEDRSLDPAAIFAAPVRARVEATDAFTRHREVLGRFEGFDRMNLVSFMDLLITLPDTFLEKVDRSTMAASLEVRVPFLDHDLVDFAVGVPGPVKTPGGRKKWLLKSALEGIVPPEVLHGPKAGLEVPYGRWLQGALRPLFFDHLAKFARRHPAVLDEVQVRRLHADTAMGRKDDSYMLWKVLNFMIWANNSDVEFQS